MDGGDKNVPRSPEPTRNVSTVPRFASFKPRQATPSLEDHSTYLTSKSESKTSEKVHRHVEARKARQQRHLHEKHGGKGKEGIRGEDVGTGQLHPHEESSKSNVGGEETGHYTEDRRSDENNIRYGTAHRYTVPKYREAGRHSLLGLSRCFKTRPELEPGRRLVTTERLERNGARSLRTSLLKESGLSRVVAQERNNAEVDASRSYLSLSPHRGRKRKRRKLNDLHPSANWLSENLEGDNIQYDSERSGEGQDVKSSSTSSDSEHEPTAVSTHVNSARERNIHLSRLVDENPADVDAWLTLIQHQELMLAENCNGLHRASSNAQKWGVVDVKLSMYETALTKTKGHPLRDQLVHGMMNEGAKVWETEKLARAWRSALKEHPGSLSLWVQYLNFRQTNFVTFTYESCREIFKDCLDLIATRQASVDVEHTRIYVFLRLTTFMRDAGFTEHAHALWQAILEYSFFEPSSDQAGSELFSFEEFWDSEVPRLGEEGGRGWKMSQRVETEPRNDPALPTTTDQHSLTAWGVCEQQRVRASTLPARTLDKVDEDDPYRVILYSDIQPFLFRPLGPEAQKHLLEAFLCFCGLPPLRLELWSNQLPTEDPFLNNLFLDPSQTTLSNWVISSERNRPFNFPMPSFITDTTSLFLDSEHWFNPWKVRQSILSNIARREWTQRSLRQLLAGLKDELFAEYLLAFESRFEVKEARKYAKNILKLQPSVRLYNGFALLEWRAGNIEAAQRVWSTALSMRSSFSETSRQDVVLVWRSWLWALLDQHDFSKALRLCLAVSDEKVCLDDLGQPGAAYLGGHATTKLRAHQYLVLLLHQNLSLNNPDLSVHYLDVLSLLAYLTSNQTLAPSLAHYAITSAHPTIAQSPTTLCLVHQSRARLLHLHAQTSASGYRPSDITSLLAESIRLFPSNTIFLSLYHFHTRRSLLTDRIRDVVPTLTSTSSSSSSTLQPGTITPSNSTIPPLFRIYTELNRPTFAGTTSHSIRSAFEKAISSSPLDSDSDFDSPSSSSSRHSPTIWKLYILWEIHVALQESQSQSAPSSHTNPTSSSKPNLSSSKPSNGMGRAISTLHRALRACPWAKELYMLAFSLLELREEMQDKDLRAVYEMMAEKGLRVHVELGL